MALILQIETTTSSCSVALSRAGETLAVKELDERNIHASSLTLFIEEVLREAGITLHDINAVAVSMGPGSYTGLRIGVSVAKGICYALDIPLLAVDTLKAMASRMSRMHEKPGALFCPMIDARRMEVYTAVFSADLETLSATEAKIIDEHSFYNFLEQHTMVFFGDGAMKCKDVLGDKSHAVFIGEFSNSAADMSQLAFTQYSGGAFEDVAYFEPYYLKEFLAK